MEWWGTGKKRERVSNKHINTFYVWSSSLIIWVPLTEQYYFISADRCVCMVCTVICQCVGTECIAMCVYIYVQDGNKNRFRKYFPISEAEQSVGQAHPKTWTTCAGLKKTNWCQKVRRLVHDTFCSSDYLRI